MTEYLEDKLRFKGYCRECVHFHEKGIWTCIEHKVNPKADSLACKFIKKK